MLSARLLAALVVPFAHVAEAPRVAAAGDLRIASVFGDHMVLQRETRATLWGGAKPGEAVTILTSWDAQRTETRAGADGRWRVAVETPKAGGPYSIAIDSEAGERIELNDVLIGEVWVCSGQSNMEWPMTAIDDSEFEISTADQPAIRLFDVAHQIAMEPTEECEGEWQACTPENVRSFSAVAYFFGRALNERLDVPIGLLSTNWGGTVAESWTSAETLRRDFPEFGEALDRVDAALANPAAETSVEELRAAWWETLASADPGLAGRWMEASVGTGAEDWATATLPGTWADLDLGGFDGCLWYRREVHVPDAMSGAELTLELGPIDDMDLTWFNGRLVGETKTPGNHATPRRYTVPADAVRVRSNTIVICAVDTGGVGRVGSDAEGMRLTADGVDSVAVSLAGNWQYRRGAPLSDFGAFPRSNWFHQNYPTALSNGMLEPLVPYGIRGAIWYQGESNVPRAVQYRRLFPAMIADWRRRFGQGPFPFYFVQLAPFAYGNDVGAAAELREAQAMTLALENTGMAVTMDIGNPRDIHPRNKQDVGHRLALLALAKDYGYTELEYSGPVYRAMEVRGDRIVLSFDHAAGLTSGEAPPSHFTIAGADQVFHPATATIEGEAVVVHSPEVPTPLAVRYAWGAADEPNLANGAGLPSSSFRTDDWPPVTRER